MTNVDAIFGKIISDLRRSARLSQEELAERAGIYRTYVSQFERGLKSPTLDTVLKLSKALGTRPSTVMRKLEAELPLIVSKTLPLYRACLGVRAERISAFDRPRLED